MAKTYNVRLLPERWAHIQVCQELLYWYNSYRNALLQARKGRLKTFPVTSVCALFNALTRPSVATKKRSYTQKKIKSSTSAALQGKYLMFNVSLTLFFRFEIHWAVSWWLVSFPPERKSLDERPTEIGSGPRTSCRLQKEIYYLKRKAEDFLEFLRYFSFPSFLSKNIECNQEKKTHLNGNNRQQKHREGAAGALVGHFTARGIYGNRAEAYQRQGRWAFVAMGNRILIVNEKKKKTEYTDTITEKEAHRKQQTRTRVKKKKLPLFTCDSHWSRAIYSGVQTIIFSIWERERRLFRAPTEVMMIGI